MSSKPISIAVVVPSFNHGRFIDDCINSLLDQSYPDLEILVMDGGSTDDTVKRLKAFGERINWVSEKDGGQTDAIIKGFARTKAPWITWLNSDDVQCDNALWKAAEAAAKYPDAEVLLGRGHYMDIDGSKQRPYPTIAVGPGIDVRKEIFEKGYMAQPSLFYTRALYDRVGGLNISRNFCMDSDLWARFAVSGAVFAPIDGDISGNRWYEDTKTSAQTLNLYAEVLATQYSVFGSVSPFFVQSVSDYLYSIFHSKFFGDNFNLFIRWAYFKGIWIAINARNPSYCLKGLFTETIAKSGPIVGDHLKFGQLLGVARRYMANRSAQPCP